MTLHVGAGGVWKDIVDPQVGQSSTFKDINGGWVGVSGVWKRIYNRSVDIPSGGIIMYYNTGTPPTGWSRYGDAARLLLGWDGTLSGIGLTGGSKDLSFSISAGADHTGDTATYFPSHSYVNNYAWTSRTNYAAGSHGHTVTEAGASRPGLLRAQLIQAGSAQSTIPQYGVLFGNSIATTNLSMMTTSKLFPEYYSNSGAIAVGTLAADGTTNFTTNSVSTHRHGAVGFPFSGGGASYRYAASGDHSHAFTVTDVNWDLKRKYVRAFQAAAAVGAPVGSIIGWTTNTAPSGWALCNGSNGTIDLRSYFICCDSSETYGSSDGDNTVDFTYTTDSKAHTHKGVSAGNYVRGGRYHGNSVSHNHAGSQNQSKLYPYLTLSFIQAIGA